jgi:hypothetical protein
MDESNSTEEKKRPGRFWQGFLISLAAWLLDIGLAILIFSLAMYDSRTGWLSLPTRVFRDFGLILGVVWLPVAIIAGFRSLRKGIKHCIGLVLATLIAAPLVVGCGFTILVVLARG